MFNVNFCRNPMCPNFGPAPNRKAYAERYKVDAYSNFRDGPLIVALFQNAGSSEEFHE